MRRGGGRGGSEGTRMQVNKGKKKTRFFFLSAVLDMTKKIVLKKKKTGCTACQEVEYSVGIAAGVQE